MRIINFLYLAIACFYIINPAISQTTLWEKATGHSNSMSSVIPLNNNEYIIIDNRINHNPYGAGFNYQDIILYKFNFTDGFYDSTIVSSEDGYIFCANTIDVDGQNFVGYGLIFNPVTSRYKPYLFWFDNNLTIIGDTVLESNSDYNIYMVTHVTLSDNSSAISGRWISISNPQDKGAYFVKLNNIGNVSFDLFLPCPDPPFDLIEAPGSTGIYGVCRKNITFFNNDLTWDSIIWEQPLINTLYLSPSALLIDSSRFLQIANGYESVLPPPEPPRETFLLFRDANAQIIDTISVGIPDSSEHIYNDALRLSSEGKILLGLNINPGELAPGYSAPSDHDILIQCLTKNGILVWKKKISLNKYLVLQTITPLEDGGCIIAGTIWDWQTTWPNIKDNFFIGRLTKDGDLISEVPEISFKRPVIYPNPASNYLFIEGILDNMFLTLYSISGEKVFETSVNANQGIPLLNLNNGLYFYRLETKGYVQSFGKLVIIK